MKWIEMVPEAATGKTKRWRVVRIDNALGSLGRVKFYPQWRKYAFFPEPDTLFEADCMRDIANFCADQTATWRAAGRK